MVALLVPPVAIVLGRIEPQARGQPLGTAPGGQQHIHRAPLQRYRLPLGQQQDIAVHALAIDQLRVHQVIDVGILRIGRQTPGNGVRGQPSKLGQQRRVHQQQRPGGCRAAGHATGRHISAEGVTEHRVQGRQLMLLGNLPGQVFDTGIGPVVAVVDLHQRHPPLECPAQGGKTDRMADEVGKADQFH